MVTPLARRRPWKVAREAVTLDHLSGYEGARPVHIGNAAYKQRQHDVWGAVIEALYLHASSRDHFNERWWPILQRQVQQLSG